MYANPTRISPFIITSFPSSSSRFPIPASPFVTKPRIGSSSAALLLPIRFCIRSKASRARRIACDYSCLEVNGVNYRPPGTNIDVLNGISLSLQEKSGHVIHDSLCKARNLGRSNLSKPWPDIWTKWKWQNDTVTGKPTSGSIYIQRYNDDGHPNQPPEPLSQQQVGIVFQFPERFFLADNILDELIFGLPRQRAGIQMKQLLSSRLHKTMTSVGLTEVSLDTDPRSLSGGCKRRLALAIQLVQTPKLLILDEPLAGLDWKARADVVRLLKIMKKELTLLVVSHDIAELASLVDRSWKMEIGGVLRSQQLFV